MNFNFVKITANIVKITKDNGIFTNVIDMLGVYIRRYISIKFV